jgi:hypothetical protein
MNKQLVGKTRIQARQSDRKERFERMVGLIEYVAIRCLIAGMLLIDVIVILEHSADLVLR